MGRSRHYPPSSNISTWREAASEVRNCQMRNADGAHGARFDGVRVDARCFDRVSGARRFRSELLRPLRRPWEACTTRGAIAAHGLTAFFECAPDRTIHRKRLWERYPGPRGSRIACNE